jgi:hypothetical protein
VSNVALAASWFKRIGALQDPALRRTFAQNELYSSDASAVAEALDEVCQRVDRRRPGGRETLTAFAPTLTNLEHIDRVEAVRSAAIEEERQASARLLRCSTRQHHTKNNELQQTLEGALEREGRPLSLGERRALARQPSRSILRKLLRDPHPMVAHLVLANPRVTEEDILIMACRRPAIISVLHEVAQQWFHHARVRMALVLNPGSPAAISVPLLGLLVRHELAQVVNAMDISPMLRDTARQLYTLRPPLDTDELAGEPEPEPPES